MASLHFVDDFRELLEEPPGLDPYDYHEMFPAGTWRERQRSTRTLALLRRIDHTVRALLEDGERVRFLTHGSLLSPWEAFFVGWVMYYAARRAVVFTDRRILLLGISLRGEPREIRAQVDYRSVEDTRTTIFGNLRIRFGDGTSRVLQGVPRAHRKRIREIVPLLRAEQPDDGGPVVHDVEDLCPHCARPPGEGTDRCPTCGGFFKSANHATLLSAIFPGAGDLYLGHKVFGTIEVLVASLLWLGVLFFGLEAGGTPGVFVRGVALMVLGAHGVDAVSTRLIALKGLHPAEASGGGIRRLAFAAAVPVLVLAVTAGPVAGRRGLAPTGRVVMGDSLPARQVEGLRDAGYLEPDERLVRFYAPGTSVLQEGILLTDRRVSAFSALPANRFYEAMDYGRIIDVAREPAPHLPDHTMLLVAREAEGGFWFPLPSADGQDAAFEADLVARWRAHRLAHAGGVWFDGGTGASAADAVLIRGLAPDTDPEPAERYWMRVWFGPEDEAWTWTERRERTDGGRRVDRVSIRRLDGMLVVRYFAVGGVEGG